MTLLVWQKLIVLYIIAYKVRAGIFLARKVVYDDRVQQIWLKANFQGVTTMSRPKEELPLAEEAKKLEGDIDLVKVLLTYCRGLAKSSKVFCCFGKARGVPCASYGHPANYRTPKTHFKKLLVDAEASMAAGEEVDPEKSIRWFCTEQNGPENGHQSFMVAGYAKRMEELGKSEMKPLQWFPLKKTAEFLVEQGMEVLQALEADLEAKKTVLAYKSSEAVLDDELSFLGLLKAPKVSEETGELVTEAYVVEDDGTDDTPAKSKSQRIQTKSPVMAKQLVALGLQATK